MVSRPRQGLGGLEEEAEGGWTGGITCQRERNPGLKVMRECVCVCACVVVGRVWRRRARRRALLCGWPARRRRRPRAASRHPFASISLNPKRNQ